jgi:diaminohydroxyphosphoribosylaminopyrimidine deaminase/5-amino-6-(5-phosphoribosylamino)uracil reductase
VDERPSTLGLPDHDFLERARELSRLGWGRVHPNPLVGCVIVKDGAVVGQGFHGRFGGPHAEIVALDEALHLAEGATAFVTLEPCNHHGKTPPCTEALLQAGVARVVYGASDPGAESGGGAERLRQAGLEVVGPVWGPHEAMAENPALYHTSRTSRPFIALKLALSLDGRISASRSGRSRITGEEAEREVHRLRSGFDAILIGAGTARIDDPRLTVRLAPAGRTPPRRLLLDSDATLPSGAALLEDTASAPVHVFTRFDAPEGDMERLETAGAHVHPVEGDEDGLDLEGVLEACWELGLRSILCEGGARLGTALLREDLVQRLYLFLAPLALGPSGVPAFDAGITEVPWSDFSPAFRPELFGRDTLLVLDRRKNG